MSHESLLLEPLRFFHLQHDYIPGGEIGRLWCPLTFSYCTELLCAAALALRDKGLHRWVQFTALYQELGQQYGSCLICFLHFEVIAMEFFLNNIGALNDYFYIVDSANSEPRWRLSFMCFLTCSLFPFPMDSGATSWEFSVITAWEYELFHPLELKQED